MINKSKKIEKEYQFDEKSSQRIYSDSEDDVELELISGAYSTALNEDLLINEAESLDNEEVFGCGCGEIHENDCE